MHEASIYPHVDKPSPFSEIYFDHMRPLEDQQQAAYLLILYNILFPVPDVDIYGVVPAGDLEMLGLSGSLYAAAGLKRRGRLSVSDLVRPLTLPHRPFEKLPPEFLKRQQTAARQINKDPSLENIVVLAAISSVHPDPLVQLAAAPLLYELTDRRDIAFRDVQRIMQFDDELLKNLGATLYTRLLFPGAVHSTGTAGAFRKTSNKPVLQGSSTIVLHGTLFTGKHPGDWWRNGSDFLNYLKWDVPIENLNRVPLHKVQYEWTGGYSHQARLDAAASLVNFVKDDVSCIGTVAHSHGGNVSLLASHNFDIGRIVLLATPIHKNIYSPSNHVGAIFSVRSKADLVILADGGENVTPGNWQQLEEEVFVGWFSHSAPRNSLRWEREEVKEDLPKQVCP